MGWKDEWKSFDTASKVVIIQGCVVIIAMIVFIVKG